MQQSNFVIDTYPETHELFCECGLVIDECGGKLKVCFRSCLSKEEAAQLNAKLVAK